MAMASSAPSRHKDVILSSAGITASLVLAEPIVYLYGFTKSEQLERPPAIVRGSLVLRITKPTKIKTVSLKFRGISRTEWPEGIPSEKSETQETKEVFAHEWRLFSSHFSSAESSSGAHQVTPLDPESSAHDDQDASNGQSLLSAALHPASTMSTPHSLVNQHDAVTKGYRVFHPAEYVYNFELLLPQRLPETLKCNFGHVKWGFNLTIERHGTFKSKLTGHKDYTVLRSLGPSNLESSEPIVISRDWEDLLHYEIIIAGKAFAIGQSFNVAFSLMPMAKVKCHRIRLYITEHVEYYCRNRRIHRVEPSHKFMLLEHPPKSDNKTNILEPSPSGMSGVSELEFNVQIPESFPNRRDYLRPNANTEYIKVHHWVKAIMRLSRMDAKVDGKPKCYEVSIDSPITLVDNRTTGANDLPEYSGTRGNTVGDAVEDLRPYQEFIQKADPITPAQRAILFGRQPSIAPPPFDADVRPPQAPPPPTYDQLHVTPQGYQSRYIEYLRMMGEVNPSLAESLRERLDAGAGAAASLGAETSAEPVTETTVHQSTPDSFSSGSSTHSSGGASGGSTAPTSAEEGVPPTSANNELYASGLIPVFSQITWTEDEPALIGPDDVDPHMTVVSQTQTEDESGSSTPYPPSPGPDEGTFMDAFVPAMPAPPQPTPPAPQPQPQLVPVPQPYSALSAALGSPAPGSPAPGSPVVGSPHRLASPPPPPPPRTSRSPQALPREQSVPGSPDPSKVDEFSRRSGSDTSPSTVPPTVDSDNARLYDQPVSPMSPRAEAPAGPYPVRTSGGGIGIPLTLQTTGGADSREQLTRGATRRSSSIRTAGVTRGDEPESPLSPRMATSFPKRGAPASAPAGARMQPQMQIQRLRGVPVGPPSRRTSMQGAKMPGKSPTQSMGSPTGSAWPDSNAGQLFGERWMDPVSAPSPGSNPRYFRQSSIVSIDLARQGESTLFDSRHASRRVSEVSEISEVTDWHPLSRNNSEASVSIAEYEEFNSHMGQGRAPLLGDNESVDMALGRLDDYDFEDDRRSINSAFYNVLTP